MRASIILPLIFLRGPTLDCIRSWTTRQSFTRSEYEVILVSPGLPDERIAAARSCLTEFDSVIVEASTNLYELYRAGANKAKGEILVFCESHVEGTPDCLAEIISKLENSDYVGVSCRSFSPSSEKYVARMEGMLYAEEQAVWSKEDHWRKVNERGFAINRSAYFSFGGFDSRYEWFAGRAFSIALYEAGAKLGFAPNAVVCHHNMTVLSDLVEGVRSFSYGEILYRLEKTPSHCEHYLGDSPEIHECKQLRPAVQRIRSRLHWYRLHTQLKDIRNIREAPITLAQIPPVMLGPDFPASLVLFKAWMAAMIARIRMGFWRHLDEVRCYAAFREFWHLRLVRFYKLKTALSLLEGLDREWSDGWELRSANQLEGHNKLGCTIYNLAEAKESGLIGFYEPEIYDGRRFRWSRPQAAIAVLADPQDYKLELEVPKLRSLSCGLSLSVYFDGNRLSVRELSPTLIECDLPKRFFKESRSWHELIFSCNDLPGKLKDRTESRSLGLPLISITFRPIAEMLVTCSPSARSSIARKAP